MTLIKLLEDALYQENASLKSLIEEGLRLEVIHGTSLYDGVDLQHKKEEIAVAKIKLLEELIVRAKDALRKP